MFEYLRQIDEKIYGRYETVETNIKAASNSFYDAFLDLQENFLKIVVEKNGIETGAHVSCGELLRRPEVKDLFLNKYGVDEYDYDKMGDYTKKANEHKHRKEKHIEAETIVNYMRVFYGVSRKCVAEGIVVPPFSERYFKDLFGSMSKVEERLSAIEDVQQQILQTINKQGDSQPEKRERSDDGKSSPDGKQVLKNFIAKAEKKYNWFGTEQDFKKSKKFLVLIYAAMIFTGVISTILSSASFNLYSTFTLFENIVLVQAVILLSYTLKAQKYYFDRDLAKYNSDIFVLDGDGVWRDSNKEKKKYKYLRRISYACVIANIICIWTMGSGAIRIFATIFELVFLALTVGSVFLRINLYCMYSTLFITGYNSSGTEKVTIVHDSLQKKLFTYEEYKEKFSSFI